MLWIYVRIIIIKIIIRLFISAVALYNMHVNDKRFSTVIGLRVAIGFHSDEMQQSLIMLRRLARYVQISTCVDDCGCVLLLFLLQLSVCFSSAPPPPPPPPPHPWLRLRRSEKRNETGPAARQAV